MHIKSIVSQHRRDFKAVYECEHCGYTETRGGYDDHYYHTTVVPGLTCPDCGKTAGTSYVPRSTKYAMGVQV